MFATEEQLAQIRRREINGTACNIRADGIRLTWGQVDSLGDETLDWLSAHGLSRKTTDAGVFFTPPVQSRRGWGGIRPSTSHDKNDHAIRRSSQASKSEIENMAISGLPVDGQVVAVVSKDKKTVKLRHVWPDDVDARIWSGVQHAFMGLAQSLADETGKPVEVYAKEGFMLQQVRPEARSGARSSHSRKRSITTVSRALRVDPRHEAVSDDDIRVLRDEVASAGDFVQHLICRRALGGRVMAADYLGRSDSQIQDIQRVERMTRARARAACVKAIEAGRA